MPSGDLKPPVFLNSTEAARYLGGVKKATLDRWRCVGGGPPYYKVGRQCLYTVEDLDAFIAARRRSNTSQPGPSRG